eukprot:tig00021720_g23195.t1
MRRRTIGSLKHQRIGTSDSGELKKLALPGAINAPRTASAHIVHDGGPRSLGQMPSVARARSPRGAQAHRELGARQAGLALWASPRAPSASRARGSSGGPRSLGQTPSVARARSPRGAEAHRELGARQAGLALWARRPPWRAPAARGAPKRIES